MATSNQAAPVRPGAAPSAIAVIQDHRPADQNGQGVGAVESIFAAEPDRECWSSGELPEART
jgi:hypothetical protein